MSPEEYRLTTTYDGVTPIDGPTSIILDQLSITGLSVGYDDIVFGDSVSQQQPIIVDKFLFGANGQEWPYSYTGPPEDTEEWSDGIGTPGTIPAGLNDPFRPPFPLMLDIVPEPQSISLLLAGSLIVTIKRRAGCLSEMES